MTRMPIYKNNMYETSYDMKSGEVHFTLEEATKAQKRIRGAGLLFL
jgi:hypothetical protein